MLTRYNLKGKDENYKLLINGHSHYITAWTKDENELLDLRSNHEIP